MDIFFNLFFNLLPLYLLISVGFVAGRFFEIDRITLANLSIFICLPVVIFGFVAELEFKPVYAMLPFIVLFIQIIIGLSALKIGQKIYGDNRANLLSIAVAMGNVGYFGLPLVLFLFDAKLVGIYMFMLLGLAIYESSIGYYMAARGAFDVRTSLLKLSKFPTLYAITIGLAFNFSGMELSEQFQIYWGYFKGTYVITGMMIIGSALAHRQKLEFSMRFMSLVFLGKFIIWPLIVFAFIQFDRFVLGLFEGEVHRLLMVFSLMPPAANVVAFSAKFDLRPGKAAMVVLIGTIFALFYIPAALMLFGVY